MLVLAYLWPLAIVPLLLDKNDADLRWHAKHGLVLLSVELVLLIGFAILASLIGRAPFGVGCLLGLFVIFMWVAILSVHIAAILKALRGKRLIIPWISRYAYRW